MVVTVVTVATQQSNFWLVRLVPVAVMVAMVVVRQAVSRAMAVMVVAVALVRRERLAQSLARMDLKLVLVALVE